MHGLSWAQNISISVITTPGLGLEAPSLQIIQSSASPDSEGFSFQPPSASLGLERFSLWDLLLNELITFACSFWALVGWFNSAVLVQTPFQDDWFSFYQFLTELLCLEKLPLNFTKLNWTDCNDWVNWMELNRTAYTQLHLPELQWTQLNSTSWTALK